MWLVTLGRVNGAHLILSGLVGHQWSDGSQMEAVENDRR
jgi:hypothetical protein